VNPAYTLRQMLFGSMNGGKDASPDMFVHCQVAAFRARPLHCPDSSDEVQMIVCRRYTICPLELVPFTVVDHCRPEPRNDAQQKTRSWVAVGLAAGLTSAFKIKGDVFVLVLMIRSSFLLKADASLYVACSSRNLEYS